jgi:hypothetical protein
LELSSVKPRVTCVASAKWLLWNWKRVDSGLETRSSSRSNILPPVVGVSDCQGERPRRLGGAEEKTMGTRLVAQPIAGAQIDQLCINTIRTPSIDAIQQAKYGHPGTPMVLAPLVYTIWNQVMRFDPQEPIWPNRDRFVFSNALRATFADSSSKALEPERVVASAKELLGRR